MAEVVTVTIVNATSQMNPPASEIGYLVHNGGDKPVWMVSDGWLIWQQTAGDIELAFTRGQMRPGAQVFGYFPPAVVQIGPTQEISEQVTLVWPQPLLELWNSQSFATPKPGTYRVAVRIGYGLSPEPEVPQFGEGVEEPVLRWQMEAVSEAVALTIPPYDLQNKGP